MMKSIFNSRNKSALVAILLILGLASCQEKEYENPEPVSELTNDCIKRTLGPNIIGLPIEFAYAMALPKAKGKLLSAKVEASIAGAPGTFLEHRSFNTNSSGQDVPVLVGSPSVKDGNFTKVTFTVDTNAATLRYFYVVPEEARGKSVSFTFSATSSDGGSVSYKLGPYNVSKMDIKRNIAVSNNSSAYISVEDMAVYTAATAASVAGKIDLVYLFGTTPATISHALVSPGSNPIYLPGVVLPAGVNRKSKLRKVFNLQDRNLAQLQFGIYVDDKDFQEINLSDAPDYAIGLRAEAGVWVETQGGKYRAYIYINSVNANGSAVISILRYTI
ncbi:DUF4466 family protein [Daejeonella sp.]|uniref:DUF4466 family protein n=1 Tax=Daejeonella sp. TaxID=2805397 RepID=UPI0030BD0D9A